MTMPPIFEPIGAVMVALCLVFGAMAADLIERPGHDPSAFTFDAPRALPSNGYTMTLIGTATTQIEPDIDASIPLRDANEHALGPKLSDGQFCELAAAGSGVIGDATYQVVGTSRHPQANCRRHFSRLARKMPVAAGALGRSVFRRIDTAHGLGAAGYRLIPWRSIATSRFKVGTVMFVPVLRGWPIDGSTVHDGYVFVADSLGDAPLTQVSLVVESRRPGLSLPPGDSTSFVVDERTVVEALLHAHTID